MQNAKKGSQAYFKAKVGEVMSFLAEGDWQMANIILSDISKVPKYSRNGFREKLRAVYKEIDIQRMHLVEQKIGAPELHLKAPEDEFDDTVKQVKEYLLNDGSSEALDYARDLIDQLCSDPRYHDKTHMATLITLEQEYDFAQRMDDDADWKHVAREHGQPLGF